MLPLIEEDVQLTINGNNNTINGNDQYWLFFVRSGVVNFNDLTFSNGRAQGGNRGGGGAGMGGALFVLDGTVTVTDSLFQNNSAIGGNGGNSGTGGNANFTPFPRNNGSDGSDGSGGGAGGGGAGMGSAIFVLSGEFSVSDSSFNNNNAQGGTGANPGSGLGDAIFALHQGMPSTLPTVTLTQNLLGQYGR